MIKNLLFYCLIFVSTLVHAQGKKGKLYFPPSGSWEKRMPSDFGLRDSSIAGVKRIALAFETKNPRNMELSQAQSFGKEPFGEGIGPFADRGAPTGLIIYKGYLIGSWGEPDRPDMTHSVTKSFISTVVGLAVDKGLIKSVQDTVAKYVPPIEIYQPGYLTRSPENMGTPELLQPFSSPHNRKLNWDVMLRQTSDWEGTLWGKPDWADRPDPDANKWLNRTRNEPGTVYEYNDVRVNALAL